MTQPWVVPSTWQWTHTGDVATVVGGGTPDTKQPDNFGGSIPWLTPADLSGYTAKRISGGARNLTQAGYDGSGARLIAAGSILFSSRAPIGYVAIAENPICTNQGFKSFVLSGGVASDYAYHYLHYAKPLAVKLASGTTFLEISGANASRIPIPIPPLNEQQRIADTLDELFSDLDAAVAALERVRAKLKLYRASVLKAAVEGELTKDWREQHPGAEPASQLLQRILAERRRRWEEDQLAKHKAKDAPPPSGWKAKYREAEPPNQRAATWGLPSGWVWASFHQTAWKLRSGTSATAVRVATKYPVLRSSAVRPGAIDFNDVNFLPEIDESDLEHVVEPHDVFVTRLSGSVEFVGCCAVVEHVPDVAVRYPDRLFCAKLVSAVDAKFVVRCFSHPQLRASIEKAAKSTAGHQRISLSDLTAFVIPLPPLAEQEAIVERVEDQLSVIDHLEADIDAKLMSTQALRQAILRRAFAGQLVPQDPTDEPAAELLKRIAAERGAAMPPRPSRRRRTPATAA